MVVFSPLETVAKATNTFGENVIDVRISNNPAEPTFGIPDAILRHALANII